MTRRVAGGVLLVLAAALAAGCGPSGRAVSASAVALPYPCALRPLATLSPDFTVQQHIVATGHGKSGGFDAVLQKKGDTLVLVGLVAGVRAFVLKQEGLRISFEQSMGPPMPFPASYAVIDIHRAYYKRLPRPDDAAPSGVIRGALDGEAVEESWSNGSLTERRFSRPGQTGVVRVEYGPGCTAARCLPAWVRIVNEWLDYTVRVDNEEFVLL
jgi:hypothetical protein